MNRKDSENTKDSRHLGTEMASDATLKGDSARQHQITKHPCPDCHSCQLCSESRCRLCRKQGARQKKMSLEEQIALYDRLNQDLIR